MPSAYSPNTAEGESPANIWFERSLFDGEYLAAVAYGLHLAVFSITAYFLTCRPAKRKISWPFVIYIFLLLACGTINLASGIKFAEMAWIDDRDFPGGPSAFNTAMYSNNVETLGNAAYITANFLADGILLWRCFVIYGRSYWVMMIPTMTFMASTGLSILTLYQAAQPNASVWSHSAVIIAVPYWSLSIALNMLVSMMIVARLLWWRHTVGKKLGQRHSAMYAGIATMFVESAALYAITGLVYIICFARSSNVGNLVLGILSQVECIAPELIILRVALGRAWSPEGSNASVSTNMSFKTNVVSTQKDSGALVDMFGQPHSKTSDNHGDLSEGSRTHVNTSFNASKPSLQVV